MDGSDDCKKQKVYNPYSNEESQENIEKEENENFNLISNRKISEEEVYQEKNEAAPLDQKEEIHENKNCQELCGTLILNQRKSNDKKYKIFVFFLGIGIFLVSVGMIKNLGFTEKGIRKNSFASYLQRVSSNNSILNLFFPVLQKFGMKNIYDKFVYSGLSLIVLFSIPMILRH